MNENWWKSNPVARSIEVSRIDMYARVGAYEKLRRHILG